MVPALGYSNSSFDPADPGRLCRGRERWIDSFERDDDPELHRMVISGAAISDDSARDAFRGLSFSGLQADDVLARLFPGKVLVACCEDGHPREVPSRATGVEYYELARPGGSLARWAMRWSMLCSQPGDAQLAIAGGADVFLVLDAMPETGETREAPDFAPLADAHLDASHEGGLPEVLRRTVFLLTGYRVDGAPVRSFQPAALPDLLKLVDAVVLVHQDKHDHCLAIYTEEPLDEPEADLETLARSVGALAVPFAIPPMLARWDRALWELRQTWDERRDGVYPVPPAPESAHGWSRRGQRRGGPQAFNEE